MQSEGGYSDYLLHKNAGSGAEDDNSAAAKDKTGPAKNKPDGAAEGKEKSAKNSYKQPREKTRLNYNEQREYDSIEGEIEALEDRSAQLDEEMVKSATDFPHLMELTKEKEEVDAKIEAKMERYLELQEMVDMFNNMKS